MGEQLGRVAQPHGAEVGGEGGQADLVVGAFELARRDRQGASERREGQWSAIPALDGHLRADVDLGHELDGGLAMGGGTRAMVLPGHVVVSDKIAPIGTLGASSTGGAGNRTICSGRLPHTRAVGVQVSRAQTRLEEAHVLAAKHPARKSRVCPHLVLEETRFGDDWVMEPDDVDGGLTAPVAVARRDAEASDFHMAIVQST